MSELSAIEDPATVGVDVGVLKEYEQAMKKYVAAGHIPGFASVVLRKGKIVHTMTHGYADIETKQPYTMDTLCRLICMTKSYIAIAFMSLVDDKRASLDDKL